MFGAGQCRKYAILSVQFTRTHIQQIVLNTQCGSYNNLNVRYTPTAAMLGKLVYDLHEQKHLKQFVSNPLPILKQFMSNPGFYQSVTKAQKYHPREF